MSQIAWRAHGLEGSRLGYLVAAIGMFHRSHRAVDDCHALLEILAHMMSGTTRTALLLLLENARRKTIECGLRKPPFDLKTNSKSAARVGPLAIIAAQKPVMSISMRPSELAYSRQAIYLRDVVTQTLSALDRFSVRFKARQRQQFTLPKSESEIVNQRQRSVLVYQLR